MQRRDPEDSTWRLMTTIPEIKRPDIRDSVTVLNYGRCWSELNSGGHVWFVARKCQ